VVQPAVPAQAYGLRTGTDNLSVASAQPQVAGNAAAQDYSGLSTPSVWRTARSQSAAAKVEALSSNGMDEIEIPAFLRKQAD
jgi:cell division protein FtsZ